MYPPVPTLPTRPSLAAGRALALPAALGMRAAGGEGRVCGGPAPLPGRPRPTCGRPLVVTCRRRPVQPGRRGGGARTEGCGLLAWRALRRWLSAPPPERRCRSCCAHRGQRPRSDALSAPCRGEELAGEGSHSNQSRCLSGSAVRRSAAARAARARARRAGAALPLSPALRGLLITTRGCSLPRGWFGCVEYEFQINRIHWHDILQKVCIEQILRKFLMLDQTQRL